MHSDGGGKSFAISSSGGSFGFSNSSGGGNVAELLLLDELVDAFDLCLLFILLWLDEDDADVAVDIDDDDGEPITVKLFPIGLLLGAGIDTLSDLDEPGMGSSIPWRNNSKRKQYFVHSKKFQ